MLAGRFEADFVAPAYKDEPTDDFAFPVRRLALQVDVATRVGEMRLTGTLRATSAILWPAVETQAIVGGVVKVIRAADQAARDHTAIWRFEDHLLPFAALGRSANRGAWSFAAGWTGVALVRHVLHDATAQTTLTFDSVESFAIGKLGALIGAPSKHLGFAARYRSPGSPPEADPEMLRPGLGRLDFVLSGAWAQEFQSGIGAGTADIVVAIGGCLGAPKSAAPTRTLALRLPFLVRLGVGAPHPLGPRSLSQAGLPAGGAQIAWMDAFGAIEAISPTAAPKKRPRGRYLGGDARRSDDRRCGARRGHCRGATRGTAVRRPLGHERPAGRRRPLVGLRRRLGLGAVGIAAGRAGEFAVAGLFLGRGGLRRSGDNPQFGRGVAAALSPPAYPVGDPGRTVGDPILISCGQVVAGDGVVETPWRGGDLSALIEAGKTPAAVSGYAVQLAASRHRRPRFAALRYYVKGDKDFGLAARYLAFDPPRAASNDLALAKPRTCGRPTFAEPARGYSVAPSPNSQRRLWPVLEGRTAAIRDDGNDKASGVSGLARSLTLPRQAFGGGDHNDALLSRLVWIVEQRAPVYLPLDIPDLQAPPLGALETLPRVARLPVDDDIATVLKKLQFDPEDTSAQGFAPGSAVTMSLGERAGVATSRRIHLMTPTAGVTAFDEDFTRFGRPADVGPSVRRWLRTPRPAPLPANVGAPLSDRRPQASVLRFDRNAGFFVGPADTIQGEEKLAFPDGAHNAPWTATLVASPYTQGVVSDLWDGTARLRCRLEVAAAAAPTDDPSVVLGKLLFPYGQPPGAPTKEPSDPPGPLASASLRIGDTVLAGTRLRIEPVPRQGAAGPAAWTTDPAAQPNTPGVYWALVDVVVETSPPGAPNPGIAAAFAGAAAPVAELRLTVHPGFPDPKDYLKPSAGNAPLATADQTALARGQSRPPVTLQWSLPGVMSGRGALPLTPATLLFNDPAYDFSLANPAYNVQAKLPPQAIPEAQRPSARGAAQATFSADRSRVYRGGTVAFMFDMGFEKPAIPRAPQPAGPAVVDGDLYLKSKGDTPISLSLSLQVVPSDRTAAARPLGVARVSNPSVRIGTVHQLSLAALTEASGAPAQPSAGDALTLTLTLPSKAEAHVVALWSAEAPNESSIVNVDLTFGAGNKPKDFSLALSLLLTDEPVVEPPPALYFALIGDPAAKLAAPLHAQSPLPWRVDFRNLKNDFRSGLVRRTASFVWGFGRAKAQLFGRPVKAYLVKMDRNGQTYLPTAEDFRPPDKLGV